MNTFETTLAQYLERISSLDNFDLARVLARSAHAKFLRETSRSGISHALALGLEAVILSSGMDQAREEAQNALKRAAGMKPDPAPHRCIGYGKPMINHGNGRFSYE